MHFGFQYHMLYLIYIYSAVEELGRCLLGSVFYFFILIKKEGYPCRERTKITKKQQMSMFIINGQKQYLLIASEKARTRSFDCKDKRKILFGDLDLQNFRKEMFCNSCS